MPGWLGWADGLDLEQEPTNVNGKHRRVARKGRSDGWQCCDNVAVNVPTRTRERVKEGAKEAGRNAAAVRAEEYGSACRR